MTKAPRPASTICAFRDGSEGVEVLMVQRGHTARFMGGAWVFPGGAVDVIDSADISRYATGGEVDAEARPWMAAALRELVEEVQVWVTKHPIVLTAPEPFRKDEDVYRAAVDEQRVLDLSRLAYFANWITPTIVPVRFDTRFYAVEIDGDAVPFPDPSELAAAEWTRPEDAIARARSGQWELPFPTMKTLESFVGFADAASVMHHVRSLGAVPPVQPRMRVAADGKLEVVLPGEPGFDDLDDVPPDPDAMRRAAAAAGAAELRPPADER